MAEKKRNGEATDGETAAITKMEAVKRSLDKLGNDAKLKDLQTDIKTRFGYDMTTDHIKTCRNKILNPRPKKAEQESVVASAPAASAPTEEPAVQETITKKEAVRRSLAKLGEDATLKELQSDIREQFGIEITTNHISTTKGELRRAAKKPAAKKPSALKPEAKEEPAASPQEEPAALPQEKPAMVSSVADQGKRTAVEMEDILTLRVLLDRVGADHLKTLIDVMAR